MKITVVPAQVTTVEDRIAGNISMSQLTLLALPIFLGGGLFIMLPPVMHSAIYKIILVCLIFVLCAVLSIRIKGKIILFWLATILRYNARPRYYVYDRRSMSGRIQQSSGLDMEFEDEPVTVSEEVKRVLSLSTAEVVELERIMTDPAANLSFVANKKGGLYARITEVK